MGRYFVAPKIEIQPASSQPNGLFRSRAPQFARFKVPEGMLTIPAEQSRHSVFKTPLAADRPLRRVASSDVYFDDERSARSV